MTHLKALSQIYFGKLSLLHLLGEVIHKRVQRWSAVDPQCVHAWDTKICLLNISKKNPFSGYSNTLTLDGGVGVDVGHSSVLQHLGVVLSEGEPVV